MNNIMRNNNGGGAANNDNNAGRHLVELQHVVSESSANRNSSSSQNSNSSDIYDEPHSNGTSSGIGANTNSNSDDGSNKQDASNQKIAPGDKRSKKKRKIDPNDIEAQRAYNREHTAHSRRRRKEKLATLTRNVHRAEQDQAALEAQHGQLKHELDNLLQQFIRVNQTAALQMVQELSMNHTIGLGNNGSSIRVGQPPIHQQQQQGQTHYIAPPPPQPVSTTSISPPPPPPVFHDDSHPVTAAAQGLRDLSNRGNNGSQDNNTAANPMAATLPSLASALGNVAGNLAAEQRRQLRALAELLHKVVQELGQQSYAAPPQPRPEYQDQSAIN